MGIRKKAWLTVLFVLFFATPSQAGSANGLLNQYNEVKTRLDLGDYQTEQERQRLLRLIYSRAEKLIEHSGEISGVDAQATAQLELELAKAAYEVQGYQRAANISKRLLGVYKDEYGENSEKLIEPWLLYEKASFMAIYRAPRQDVEHVMAAIKARHQRNVAEKKPDRSWLENLLPKFFKKKSTNKLQPNEAEPAPIDFSAILAFAEKIYGKSSQQYVDLLEELALFIATLPLNGYERLFTPEKMETERYRKLYHQGIINNIEVYKHSTAYFTELISIVSFEPSLYINSPGKVYFHLGQYHIVKSKNPDFGLELLEAALSYLADNKQTAHYRLMTNAYLFNAYQTSGRLVSADRHWRQLEGPVAGDKPQLLYSVHPRYPTVAASEKRGGVVELDLQLDKKGYVVGVHIKSNSDDIEIEDAAIEAARHYRFAPQVRNDKLIAGNASALIEFNYHTRRNRILRVAKENTLSTYVIAATKYYPGLW